MSTKTPVTTSGWYELTDGKIQYFYWIQGELYDGKIVATWDEVDAIEREYTDTTTWVDSHD